MQAIRKLPWRQITGVLCLLLVGLFFWLDMEQEKLADKVLRLHVLANSDSQEDQELKLLVRDRVLATVEPWTEGAQSAQGAQQAIEAHLPELQMEAQQAVWDEGYDYPVQVRLQEQYFNTREYEQFAIPPGSYESLQVTIGEGAGKNWWCVVFPPLCNAVSTEEVSLTATEGGLSEQEVFLILEEGNDYVIKFKAIELWEGLKNILP